LNARLKKYEAKGNLQKWTRVNVGQELRYKVQWVLGEVQEGCWETFLVAVLNSSAEMLIATITECITQQPSLAVG